MLLLADSGMVLLEHRHKLSFYFEGVYRSQLTLIISQVANGPMGKTLGYIIIMTLCINKYCMNY